MNRIYVDYAASTPVDTEVVRAMEPFWQEQFANTGAIHNEGAQALGAVAAARAAVGGFIHARRSDDIIFTSGATEANNLGFFGLIEAQIQAGKSYQDLHIITTPIEHKSVLDCAKALEAKGVRVTYLPVHEDGLVIPNELKEALTPETVFVSIGYVNSEIGVVQPLHGCARVIQEFRREHESSLPYFHSDATQAPVYLHCHQEQLGVDLMSLGGQKVYGPKGIGCLYVDESVTIAPIMHGGTRERGLRPGTLPTPLIMGFAKALQLADERREQEAERITLLRDHFIQRVTKTISTAELNGSHEHRTANNANFSFPLNQPSADGQRAGLDNEFLVLQLDAKGIACSAKSACSKAGGSHVVAALGKGTDYSESAVRFSFGKDNTMEEVEYIVERLAECVKKDEKVPEMWL